MNRAISILSRCHSLQVRTLGILVAASASVPVWAQTGCEEVPEARRAQCEKVMDCMTIEDADVRRACINAAQREAAPASPRSRPTVQPARVLQGVEQVPPEEPSAGEREGPAPRMEEPSAGEREGPAPRMEEPSAGEREGPAPRMEEPSAGEREGPAPRMEEPSAGEREGPAPRMEEPSAGEREGPAPRIEEPPVVQERTVRPTQAAESKGPPTLEEQTVVTRRPAPQPDAVQPQDEPLRTPPDRFTGEVTRIHQSVLDRQVIALDNSYVFVSDQAAQARLKVGQPVEAVKARSRIGSGRAWRLTGPSRRPIDAFRARCERDEIGSDDRRRCERMLDR